MSIFSTLSQKPWMADQALVDNEHMGRSMTLSLRKATLFLLLIVIGILFTLFSVAYIGRMAYGDWRTLPEPLLLWWNTAIMVLSSLSFYRANVNADRNNIKKTRIYLLVAGALTISFIVGQLFVWRELISFGYFVSTNPSYGFFYLLTALHILHLLGGLIAWLVVMLKSFTLKNDTANFALKVNICAIYCHFLLIVWAFLFVMLLLT